MSTSDDPNVVTTNEGDTVVLEPGDEGYVDPNAESEEVEERTIEPREGELPPQDLRLQNAEGQSESEAILAARGTVVESGNPADIVPNTAQIRMGNQEPEAPPPPPPPDGDGEGTPV